MSGVCSDLFGEQNGTECWSWYPLGRVSARGGLGIRTEICSCLSAEHGFCNLRANYKNRVRNRVRGTDPNTVRVAHLLLSPPTIIPGYQQPPRPSPPVASVASVAASPSRSRHAGCPPSGIVPLFAHTKHGSHVTCEPPEQGKLCAPARFGGAWWFALANCQSLPLPHLHAPHPAPRSRAKRRRVTLRTALVVCVPFTATLLWEGARVVVVVVVVVVASASHHFGHGTV